MSLRDLIKRQGALAPMHAVPLFKQALSALDYAHNFNYVDESGDRHTGVVHRDIKPANMLLDGAARLKITDFGIVKLAGERSLTRTGFNPGTVEYMSPEQIRGLEVDARSDLYSLGVTFYEALTGRLPFPPSDTGSEYEVLRGHIELPPPPIATVKPDVPEAIAGLVMRSLQKDPGARFQSAAEFLNALIACEQSVATTIERAETKPSLATHSMTEVISYDTRQAPTTAPISSPRPIQQQPIQQQPIQQPIDQQVIDPAPINRRLATPAGQKQRRNGPMIAVALVVFLAIAGGAFVLFKMGGALLSAATNDPTHTPTATPIPATPTPTVTQEEPELKKAQEAEAEERYQEAIMLYGQYQVKHALDTDPRVKEVLDHKRKLEDFFGMFNMGMFEMNKGDYAAAERNYADALKLRPDSKLAQEGLKKAQSTRSWRRKD
jgi:tetratricopeptide (TPR) repeat protein